MRILLERKGKNGWIETDYTGRWKIVNINGKSILYLECFNFVNTWYPVPIYKRKKFWIFEWNSRIGYDFNKFKVKVYWVKEEDLQLKVIETFINICEGSCND